MDECRDYTLLERVMAGEDEFQLSVINDESLQECSGVLLDQMPTLIELDWLSANVVE